MNNRDWLRKLQKTTRDELCNYDLKDFIEISRNAFLTPRMIKILDLLKTTSYMSADLLFHLYVLSFVYRETSHFEEIVTGGLFPLLKYVPETDSFAVIVYAEGSINPKPMGDEPNEQHRPIQLNPLSGKLFDLNKEARGFVTRMRSIYNRLLSSKTRRKQPKNEQIFSRIYERERTSKCTVCNLLHDEAKKKGTTYESLRRGYYRWKKEKRENLSGDRSWPSDEFLKFCAFVSVKYVPENANSQYYFLCEEPSVETRQIYNSLHEVMKNQSRDVQLKREYDKAIADYHGQEKEAMLRLLAGKNYLPAIKELFCFIAPRYRMPFRVRAAILGDAESQKILRWQARGLCDLRLEVASQNRIRVAEITDSLSGVPIKPRSIIRSIKFQINTNTEEWEKIRSGFKQITFLPPEYITFQIHPIKDPRWETISMPATTRNFNLLMQNVDSLEVFSIIVCFSSRHNSRQEQKTVDIFRIYSSL